MKILICGGGIAGLTLALCLKQRGHEPLVVEKAPRLRGEGYMIDFFGSGFDACERLGLLPELDRIHYPIGRLAFLHDDGRERLSVDYPRLRKRLFDDHHFNFLRGDLERALHDKIADQVEIRYGTTVDGFEPRDDHVHVRLSDGGEDDFDLLAGADGVHSHIRSLAFGSEADYVRSLGCYTAAFILDEPPRGVDAADAFLTLTVPDRQVAVYPIRGNRLATFFVHRATQRVADLSRETPLAELKRCYGDLHWIVPKLLEAADSASGLYFDEVTQVVMPRWSSGRVVLLGDACQCVSLLAGQGASMAVAGAYVLAEELGDGTGDVAAALSRYEERLKPGIASKQEAGRRIAGWFVPTSRWRITVRDAGLWMSMLPLASSLLRKRLAAESIFRS